MFNLYVCVCVSGALYFFFLFLWKDLKHMPVIDAMRVIIGIVCFHSQNARVRNETDNWCMYNRNSTQIINAEDKLLFVLYLIYAFK